MTRLPSDSFLPSGAMLDPNEAMAFGAMQVLSGHSSSAVSPLGVPSAVVDHLAYHQSQPSQLHSYTQTSSFNRALRAEHQQSYLSPSRTSPDTPGQRTANLSASGYQNHIRATGPNLHSPSLIPSAVTSPGEADQTAALQLRRVKVQNRRLLESWEAERALLEENRARAEEVYKEERAIMDQERSEWAEKERRYVEEIAALRQENAQLRAAAHGTTGRFDGGDDTVDRRVRDQGTTGGNSAMATLQSRVSASGAGPGSEFLHRTAPESHPFEPLDSRMQGPGSTASITPPVQERVPSVDVIELDPQLEGIRIRREAVDRATFTDVEAPGVSKIPSPTASAQGPPALRVHEVLHASPDVRRTMDAGHTPRPSLSRVDTAASAVATNAASSAGTLTPKPESAQLEIEGAESGQGAPVRPDSEGQTMVNSEDRATLREASAEGGNAILEANGEDEELPENGEDAPLRGPLMLRNRPASDEGFLNDLNSKLMDVVEHSAEPTVMARSVRDDQSEDDRPDGGQQENGPAEGGQLENGQPSRNQPENNQPQLTGSQPTQNLLAGANGTQDSTEKVEPEIPLRMRTTNNFGAPLGTLRRDD